MRFISANFKNFLRRKGVKPMLTIIGVLVALKVILPEPVPSLLRNATGDPSVRLLVGAYPYLDEESFMRRREKPLTQYYWTPDGTLKVSFFKEITGEQLLTALGHKIEGDKIILTPKWGVPDSVIEGGPICACVDTIGIEVSFPNAKLRNYVIEVHDND